MNQNNWHAKNIPEVLTIVKSSFDGLTEEEAERRHNLWHQRIRNI